MPVTDVTGILFTLGPGSSVFTHSVAGPFLSSLMDVGLAADHISSELMTVNASPSGFVYNPQRLCGM